MEHYPMFRVLDSRSANQYQDNTHYWVAGPRNTLWLVDCGQQTRREIWKRVGVPLNAG